MSRNRGANTGPEIKLRRACFALGLRFRVNNQLFGSPDIVFPRARVVVFVDGCFWHGCPQHYKVPTARKEFWVTKMSKNRARDALVTSTLTEQGWNMVRVWEHDVRRDVAATAFNIKQLIDAKRAAT